MGSGTSHLFSSPRSSRKAESHYPSPCSVYERALVSARSVLSKLPPGSSARAEIEDTIRVLEHGLHASPLPPSPPLPTCTEGCESLRCERERPCLEDVLEEDGTISPSSVRRTDELNEWLVDTLDLRVPKGGGWSRKHCRARFELLSYAASRGDLSELRSLIKKEGVDVDEAGYDGRTVLHLTASEGLLDAVKMLVQELGAAISPVDVYGCTPLDDALKAGQAEVVAFLQSVDGEKGNPTMRSRDRSWSDCAELCHAAACGDVEVLRQLVIAHKKSVNEGDYDDRTPLHIASSKGRVEAVRCLLEELGADASPHDRWGRTPLDEAAEQGGEDVIELIKSKGGVHGNEDAVRQLLSSKASFWMAPEDMARHMGTDMSESVTISTGAQATAARYLDSWNNDVFALHDESCGHSLVVIGEALLNRHDLISHFNLDRACLRRFLLAAECSYARRGCDCLYHNSIHGADVALSTHLFLTKFRLIERLSKTQLLAMLLGALMHDFNHPGSTNAHEEDRRAVRSQLIDLVLSTDLAKHVEIVTRLRSLCASKGEGSWRREHAQEG
ncbi:MAG: hypothetical protein SGPRY_008525, partial [Prymnesium sp.]